MSSQTYGSLSCTFQMMGHIREPCKDFWDLNFSQAMGKDSIQAIPLFSQLQISSI
jgi:hypothetical protein